MPKRFSSLFSVVVFAAVTATAAWAAGEALSVQVREVRMRATPSFTGRPGASLSYGQTVSVLEEQGAWVRAGGAGGEGWLHKSALSERPLSLSSGARDAAAKASDREVAAAGKGFSSDTERAYRQSNPEGYVQVEAMLRYRYSPQDLYAFLRAGKLVPREAAR